MRILYSLTIIYIGLVLTSCSTTQQPQAVESNKLASTAIKTSINLPKNPLAVAFYTKGSPTSHYTVIGQESISKFNLGGNKRQEATIRDGMRDLAAAMGGDAVINIKHNSKLITGTVVAFEKNEKDLNSFS